MAQGRRADLEEFGSDRQDRRAAQGAIEDAERFAEETAKKLGVDAEFIMPAFEDPSHWLQKEASLPPNVDPGDSKLADPEERSRMARVFDQGLNVPKGFVLPIQRWNADAATPRAGAASAGSCGAAICF